MKPVFKTGGAGEPYCSGACSEQGGNAIFAVSLGGQQGRPGRCVTCGGHASTGDAMAVPQRGMIALYCRSCLDSRKAHAYIESMNECAWCGTPLDRSASSSQPAGLFQCLPGGKVTVDYDRLKQHLQQMKIAQGLVETRAVFVSSQGGLEKAVAFPYLSEFQTMRVDPNYLTWYRNPCPVYLLRTAEDKWVETWARCSFDDGRPVDADGFEKSITMVLEGFLSEEERTRRREEERRKREEERRLEHERTQALKEQKRRASLVEARKAQGACTMCGEPLGWFHRLLKRQSHPGCSTLVG
jgi:hypothetical protein